MNLLSTRINATGLLSAMVFAFGGAPANAAVCNGNGIDDGQETLVRPGDYAGDGDVDDLAARAARSSGSVSVSPLTRTSSTFRNIGRDTSSPSPAGGRWPPGNSAMIG